MKVEKYDNAVERLIVTGMIVDRSTLSRLAPRWNKDGLFRSKWANIVGRWCVDYFGEYEDAPGRNVVSLFTAWSERHKDKETVGTVESFLSALSREYSSKKKSINADYVIDQAQKHFNRVKAKKVTDLVTGYLAEGDVDEAVKTLESFNRLDVGIGSGIDVLSDKSVIRSAFESQQEPLITYPGALGKFFGAALERDGLVGFMGPEKRGKTWWLLDVCWRAMEQGRRTAFFEVGDLSEAQIVRRFMIRAAGRPLKAGEYKMPVEITNNGRGDDDEDTPSADVEYEKHSHDDDLTWREAWKACRRITKGTNGDLLRLSVHPTDSISVTGIEAVLKEWEREGWAPDVIGLDYADILAPISGTAETRDQINTTWKRLRSMSQKFHALVVTATQTDSASYKKRSLDRTNFSEDKRKFAHVTGMVGINVTDDEKAKMVTRLNWIQLREWEFDTNTHCHVAGCLPVANPAFMSTF